MRAAREVSKEDFVCLHFILVRDLKEKKKKRKKKKKKKKVVLLLNVGKFGDSIAGALLR